MTPELVSFYIKTLIILLVVLVVIWLEIERRSWRKRVQARKDAELNRHHTNPVLSPVGHVEWEASGTFNPAALHDGTGKVHLIYRAVGADGVSRLGYASSENGLDFERLTHPVFEIFHRSQVVPGAPRRYDPVMYPSGGSWGGCEDPRMVKIDDKIYVTFSAFDGWDFIRIGMISINEQDFLARKWKWSKPILLSPAGKINKNWVIFPEKINGKFAILHSITPKIQIAFVDKLEDLSNGKKVVNSIHGQKIPRNEWDTWVRGVGPPPIKTERGWLVFYHAVSKDESHKYKLGAMLLDLNDPEKIIGRSSAPLLVPDMWYENDSKPGVVYACGAVVKDGTIYLYYGGGDKYVCVAHMPLQELLDSITLAHPAE